jgi:hypothetical protein
MSTSAPLVVASSNSDTWPWAVARWSVVSFPTSCKPRFWVQGVGRNERRRLVERRWEVLDREILRYQEEELV